MAAERSKFREFAAFLSSVRGDLANITAPPSFLAPVSVTECGSCWTERPSVFVAPALEDDASRRAMLVMKWILVALRAQFYIGGDTKSGIKKPLNAFLGELFFGEWQDSKARVKLTCEQISHHPPMTAVFMRSDEFGIWGEGYTRVEMTFNGNIAIKQTGHAVLHIDKFDEDHLIFLPNANVKGFLSGRLYPELSGTYHIVSSSGFVSELRFSGQGFLSGTKNSFEASIYHHEDPTKKPIYIGKGQWSDRFIIRDCRDGSETDQWDHNQSFSLPAPLQIASEEQQDSWETRRAWRGVFKALKANELYDVVHEKTKVEEAQRQMRKEDKLKGKVWDPVFFSRLEPENYTLWSRLAAAVNWELKAEKTKGVWKYDRKKADCAKKPFHGDLTPCGRMS